MYYTCMIPNVLFLYMTIGSHNDTNQKFLSVLFSYILIIFCLLASVALTGFGFEIGNCKTLVFSKSDHQLVSYTYTRCDCASIVYIHTLAMLIG